MVSSNYYENYVGPSPERIAGLKKLADMAYLEREIAMREQERLKREQRMLEKRAQKEQAEKDRNWFGTAAKGAQLGSAFGPYGMLIGGIAGSALGGGKAMMSRYKDGPGGFKNALKSVAETGVKPLGDKFDMEQDIPLDALAALGGKGAAALQGAKLRQAMGAKEQASAEQAAIAENNAYNMQRIQQYGKRPGLNTGLSLDQAYEPNPKPVRSKWM